MIVYSEPTCRPCRLVKDYLRSKGVRFTEVDISQDEAEREALVRMTGEMSVPVTQYGDRFVVGFSRRRLDELLECAATMAVF